MSKLIIETPDEETANYLKERAEHAIRLKGKMPFWTTNREIIEIHNFVLSNNGAKFKVSKNGLQIQIETF